MSDDDKKFLEHLDKMLDDIEVQALRDMYSKVKQHAKDIDWKKIGKDHVRAHIRAIREVVGEEFATEFMRGVVSVSSN